MSAGSWVAPASPVVRTSPEYVCVQRVATVTALLEVFKQQGFLTSDRLRQAIELCDNLCAELLANYEVYEATLKKVHGSPALWAVVLCQESSVVCEDDWHAASEEAASMWSMEGMSSVLRAHNDARGTCGTSSHIDKKLYRRVRQMDFLNTLCRAYRGRPLHPRILAMEAPRVRRFVATPRALREKHVVQRWCGIRSASRSSFASDTSAGTDDAVQGCDTGAGHDKGCDVGAGHDAEGYDVGGDVGDVAKGDDTEEDEFLRELTSQMEFRPTTTVFMPRTSFSQDLSNRKKSITKRRAQEAAAAAKAAVKAVAKEFVVRKEVSAVLQSLVSSVVHAEHRATTEATQRAQAAIFGVPRAMSTSPSTFKIFIGSGINLAKRQVVIKLAGAGARRFAYSGRQLGRRDA